MLHFYKSNGFWVLGLGTWVFVVVHILNKIDIKGFGYYNTIILYTQNGQEHYRRKQIKGVCA